jgi:hypothetical protein
MYCICTIHGICIIQSCAVTVYYALLGGGGGGAAHSEHVGVLCPDIKRVLHTRRTMSLRLRGLHFPVDP